MIQAISPHSFDVSDLSRWIGIEIIVYSSVASLKGNYHEKS